MNLIPSKEHYITRSERHRQSITWSSEKYNKTIALESGRNYGRISSWIEIYKKK